MLGHLSSVILFLSLCAVPSIAQEAADPKHAELAISAYLKSLHPQEFDALLAKARAGNAESQYLIGLAYRRGVFLPKDDEKASEWFQKSAEQGYARAQRDLGMMWKDTNPSAAEFWLLRAATQGDSAAEFWLGVAYEKNWFGTVDPQEALKWYRKAAMAGDPDAQYWLGQKYERGEDLKQDYKLAAEWYRRAAEHFPNLGGAGHARYHLSLLYLSGQGLPQDYAQAYFWFSLDGPVKNDEEYREHLTPAQILDIDQKTKIWREKHQPHLRWQPQTT